jgi:general secretion pathway protein H
MAILAIIAALIPPAMSHGTSRVKLYSYAVGAAALLKTDRNAALHRFTDVATEVDAKSRVVRSGATGRALHVPTDVTFDALLAATCDRKIEGSSIRFFPSGMSCGGVIALTRLNFGYEVRVNWLTGAIEIVAINPT